MSFLPTNQTLFIYSNTYESDTDLNNYIRTVAWTYAKVADQMNANHNYKATYACNKMFNHYCEVLARLNA